jgi:hypothetical protein
MESMKEIAYSPSQTSEWASCPVKRYLNYKLGLKPRRLGKGDIAAIGGKGFGRAMESWYTNGDQELALSDGLNEIEKAKQSLIDKGRQVPDKELAYFNSIEARVEHSVKKYLKDDPIIQAGFKIEDVELSLEDHGNARIDIGARDAFGLSVIDFKFKMSLLSKWYDREVARYKNSWQQYHYGWAYSEHKKEPVNNYYICLVVCEPRFSARLHEFPIHPEGMEMWKKSAERIWTNMREEDEGLKEPYMSPSHEDQFGPCPYQEACFTHRWDMDLMLAQDYVVAKD